MVTFHCSLFGFCFSIAILLAFIYQPTPVNFGFKFISIGRQTQIKIFACFVIPL